MNPMDCPIYMYTTKFKNKMYINFLSSLTVYFVG